MKAPAGDPNTDRGDPAWLTQNRHHWGSRGVPVLLTTRLKEGNDRVGNRKLKCENPALGGAPGLDTLMPDTPQYPEKVSLRQPRVRRVPPRP